MYDVAVVGAGPAGAAAALAALRSRPGARVLLLDRHDFPRDKCCGDGVAPHALDELARLGVADVLADRVRVGAMRLVSPRGVEAAHPLARPDYVIPRLLFDARLVAAAVARGAVLKRHTVRRLDIRADHVVLDDAFAARVVVGADGANGVVRRQLGVPRQDPATVAVAVRGYVPFVSAAPEQVIVMDGRDWPAYAWRFDGGDGVSNVGFGMLLPSLQAAGHGRSVLESRMLSLLPESAGATGLRSHHLPLSTGRPRARAGRVLLAGDAASLVNPLTGEGIYYALMSGRLAGAAAVGSGDPGLAYRDGLALELGTHLRHTTLISRITAHPRVLEGGVRAAAASAQTMDALVEMGLGRGRITVPLVRGLAREALRRR